MQPHHNNLFKYTNKYNRPISIKRIDLDFKLLVSLLAISIFGLLVLYSATQQNISIVLKHVTHKNTRNT